MRDLYNSKIVEEPYDPLRGVDPDMPEWQRQTELCKAGPDCAEFIIDHMLL